MRMVRVIAVLLAGLCVTSAFAQEPQASNTGAADLSRVIDTVIERERGLVRVMGSFSPVVETYFQGVRPDAELGTVPISDKYFLGRLETVKGVKERMFVDPRDTSKKLQLAHSLFRSVEILPSGFSSMIFVDEDGLDKTHYTFRFLRREFLGEVRCLVFEVAPVKNSGPGRFLGRIWVEDRDLNIVRFNGTFTQPPRGHVYFHMDSWRSNLRPGVWLPSHVYTEESDLKLIGKAVRFKAQTRLWGYDLTNAGRQQEFTTLTVDAPAPVKDETQVSNEAPPVHSLRAWQAEAEANVLERLEKAGLLAPAGEVDAVLNTVVNNLQVTNNLDLSDVHCRVLLTTPLESFAVGRTIVISRGLLDVLPDEASLAMVLSHELAHVALGHQLDTKFAFADRMYFEDENVYRVFGFKWNDAQEREADQRGVELLKKSPYAGKLESAGLFLRAIEGYARVLPGLLTPELGNGLIENGKVVRMTALMTAAPQLQPRRTDQIPALPVGARIKLDPWSDRVEMSKAKPVPLVSAREKMTLEVTPIIPYLARIADVAPVTSSR